MQGLLERLRLLGVGGARVPLPPVGDRAELRLGRGSVRERRRFSLSDSAQGRSVPVWSLGPARRPIYVVAIIEWFGSTPLFDFEVFHQFLVQDALVLLAILPFIFLYPTQKNFIDAHG